MAGGVQDETDRGPARRTLCLAFEDANGRKTDIPGAFEEAKQRFQVGVEQHIVKSGFVVS